MELLWTHTSTHWYRLCLSVVWLVDTIYADVVVKVLCSHAVCLRNVFCIWRFIWTAGGDSSSLRCSDLAASWLCVWSNSAVLVFRAQHQAPMSHPSQHCLSVRLSVCLFLQLTHPVLAAPLESFNLKMREEPALFLYFLLSLQKMGTPSKKPSPQITKLPSVLSMMHKLPPSFSGLKFFFCLSVVFHQFHLLKP